MILKGSDKWNEQLRIYANYVSADGKLERSLGDHLANDRYGIAYVAAPTAKLGGEAARGLKILALAEKDGVPSIASSLETLHGHNYPRYSRLIAYDDRDPN